MKQNARDEGRHYYHRAIEEAGKLQEPKLVLRALLNLFIAEIDTGGTVPYELLRSAAEKLSQTIDASVLTC